MKYKIYKQLIKTLSLFLLLFSIALSSQQAKKATGGTGLYKDRIWWLNFEGISLATGGSQTRIFTVGSATVTVVIDQITFSGRRYDGSTNLTQLRLEGYNSSFAWPDAYLNNHGDGLDQMYNIGGTEAKNQLYYALTNNINGDGNNTGIGITTTFRMQAYVNGLNTPLSLVFASAETDETFEVGSGYEYTKSTTNGSAWQLLEKKVQSPNTIALQRLKFSNANLTAEMSMGAHFNPGNVALLYTTKAAASSTTPLVVNTTMICGGKSAIAIGLILDQDGGDAPASFGTAVHASQPLLTGGNPTAATQYLSSSPSLASGTLIVPNNLYLGSTPPDNDATIFTSANCDADDLNGVDDEDAFSTNPVVLPACQDSYSLTIPVHNTSGSTAYLRGWIDFNGDGAFQTTESVSASVPNGATSAILTWTGVVPITTTGFRVMRLRISNNNLAASEYSTTVFSGEVEDHRIQFLAVQTPTTGSITHATCSVPKGSFTITNYNSVLSYTFSPSLGIMLDTATGKVTADPGTYTITVTSGNCTASTNAKINYNSGITSGTATANQTIPCRKSPTPLALTGAIGTIQWQVSTDNILFTDIPSATTASYAPGALSQTTYYRARVTYAGCSDYSNVITITVNINDCTSPEDPCYDNIIGNDFTWFNGSQDNEYMGYFNHHGWEGFVNSWTSTNVNNPEAGSPLKIYRQTTIQPGTTGGFVFDIFALDNSFNMEINGTKLAVQELQFQFDTDDQIPGNVQFSDGSYTGSGVPDIWELYGDKDSDKPIIRVAIDASGGVKLYGSKISYDNPSYLLEEMQLIGGNTFNTILWHENQNNEVIISQLIASETMMVGYGYGRLEVPCDGDMPCTNPALGGPPNSYTKFGITTQSKQASWPENIPNGFITLESKDKGMVISRVASDAAIVDPKEGMLIYDIAAKCVKLYDGTSWKCIKNICD